MIGVCIGEIWIRADQSFVVVWDAIVISVIIDRRSGNLGEQVVISSPTAGTYTLKITHKGDLKTSTLVAPWWEGETDVDFHHEAGGHQDFSLVISGNLAPNPGRPILRNLESVGKYFHADLHSYIGLRFQVQHSADLIEWEDVPNLDPITMDEQIKPLTIYKGFSPPEFQYYRVKELAPEN